jgi:hypothetical protein
MWWIRRRCQHESLLLTLSLIHGEVHKMSAQMDALTKAVHDETTVVASVLTFIQGLKDQIQALIASGADPVALQALADELVANQAKLSTAIATVPAPALVPPVVAST